MKTRMSVVDIRAIVAELREQIIGMRLANLYDINKKTYLLKFAKTDEKIVVLIESGIRIHSTAFERDKSKMPSAFVLKVSIFSRDNCNCFNNMVFSQNDTNMIIFINNMMIYLNIVDNLFGNAMHFDQLNNVNENSIIISSMRIFTTQFSIIFFNEPSTNS